MRLKSLNVRNYRGLKGDHNIIDFDKSEIIFLIGENNTGKSTFLNAYSFFINPKPVAQKKDFYNNDFSNHIEIEAQFTVVPEEDIKDKNLSKDDPEWIKKWTDSEHIIKIKKVWTDDQGAGTKHTFNPSTNTYQEGGFGGFDTLLTKYAPQVIIVNAVITVADLETNINEIITKNHIKKLETSYADSYANIKKEFEKLKDDISKSDDINEVNKRMNVFFTEIFSSLVLSIYPIPDEGVDLSKSLKSTHGISVHDEKSGLSDMDLKQNGHGIIRQAFFSFLSTYQKNIEGNEKQYLILYEEPELYLHPEAVFSLRSQLYKLAENSPYQILCATHSPLMIDLEKSHASLVRLVKKQDNTTMTYQVHFNLFDSEYKNHLQMINRFNPHVCETFFAQKIVLVEGDTEAVFYREIIGRYYPDKKAYILNTGSKANMVFYQKILTHFGISHIVVHDSDTPIYKNEDGNEKTNPMFSYNEAIWKQLEESNKSIPGLARRFVHFKDFETAHNYKISTAEGKPLSAYNFARDVSKNNNLPCFQFLDDLFGKNEINVTQEELRKKVDALVI